MGCCDLRQSDLCGPNALPQRQSLITYAPNTLRQGLSLEVARAAELFSKKVDDESEWYDTVAMSGADASYVCMLPVPSRPLRRSVLSRPGPLGQWQSCPIAAVLPVGLELVALSWMRSGARSP